MNQLWLFCFRSISFCLSFLMVQSIARADLIVHSTETAFNSAISGRARTSLNFEGELQGTSIANGSFYNNTVSFNTALRITDGRQGFLADAQGSPPTTLNGINTVSPINFLGTDSVANRELIASSLTMTFRTPSNAIGLYVFSFEQLNPNEVSLRVGSSTLSINIANELVLDTAGKTTSYAYFLGISDTNPLATFSTADLVLTPGVTGPIRVGIDNMIVAVPEPNSIALCALGLGATTLLRGWRRKRRS